MNMVGYAGREESLDPGFRSHNFETQEAQDDGGWTDEEGGLFEEEHVFVDSVQQLVKSESRRSTLRLHSMLRCVVFL